MVKKLSRIGNSLGVILDRPVLELLQIDENTPLEITTDGDVLMLRPVRGDKKDRVRASAAKMVKAHAKTLAKLAFFKGSRDCARPSDSAKGERCCAG